MTADLRVLLARVVAGVSLAEVRLVEASAVARIRNPSAVPDAQMTVSDGARVLARDEHGFTVGVRLASHVVERGGEPSEQSPVVISATYELRYQLADAEGASDDVLAEFARVNGTFNAWPYLREFVQSMSTRMNLPPLMLPVLKTFGPRQAETAKAVDEPPRKRRLPEAVMPKKRRLPKV